MSITGKNYICSACGQRFQFQSEEEELEDTHGYQEPVKCPACNAVIRHKRGSGRDQGQSHLHYGPCPKCGSQTELFPMQGGEYTALCPECARAYSSSSY
jgi:DNA-directed RNA polymerase subunit RPC12/RpoP